MTAFLVVADGDDAVTIDSVEPRSLNAHFAIGPELGTPSTAAHRASPCSRRGQRRATSERRWRLLGPRLGAQRG